MDLQDSLKLAELATKGDRISRVVYECNGKIYTTLADNYAGNIIKRFDYETTTTDQATESQDKPKISKASSKLRNATGK
jgi:hypothetical protein